MDLGLYIRILWRFKLLVAVGLALGIVLFVRSSMNVQLNGLKPPTLTPKQQTLWKSDATLLVTQAGEPWGRSVVNESRPIDPAKPYMGTAPRFADAGRFTSLAIIYTHVVVSDPVRKLIEKDGPLNGQVESVAVSSPDGNSWLPMVKVSGISTTGAAAAALANRAARAFQRYLTQVQEENQIPPKQRVLVPIITEATGAVLFAKPSPVRSVFLFALVMAATVVLAFILENARPRTRPGAASEVRAEETHGPAATEEPELPRTVSIR